MCLEALLDAASGRPAAKGALFNGSHLQLYQAVASPDKASVQEGGVQCLLPRESHPYMAACQSTFLPHSTSLPSV